MEAFTIHLDRKLGRRGGKNPLQRSPRPMKSTDCHGASSHRPNFAKISGTGCNRTLSLTSISTSPSLVTTSMAQPPLRLRTCYAMRHRKLNILIMRIDLYGIWQTVATGRSTMPVSEEWSRPPALNRKRCLLVLRASRL
jgi:hypothetical protein